MSLRFIFGRAGYGKSRYCIEDIKENLKNGDTHPLILVVPEQFSFQSERNLIQKVGKDRNLRTQVMSFRRMSHRVLSEVGGLTREHMDIAGRAMLIYKIVNNLKDDLKVYSKSATQNGFVDTISEIITELKKYDVGVDELKIIAEEIEDEALKNKLHDLSIIFENYENAVHENYIDAEDDMNILYDKLDMSHIFDGAEIYFDEFSSFTPQQYKIIEKLMLRARRVNVTLTTDFLNGTNTIDNTDLFAVTKSTEEKILSLAMEHNIAFDKPVNLNDNKSNRFMNSPEIAHIEKHIFSFPYSEYKGEVKDIKLFKAINIYAEIEEMARDIIKNVRENSSVSGGLRYRDIVIAGRDMKRYESLVRAIFGAYNIPYFIDERRDITGNPLIVFVVSVLEIFNRNWSYEAVFRYLKTGMIDIDSDDVDIIENYVLSNGIKGNRWREDHWDYRTDYGFKRDNDEVEDEALKKINEIKNKITDPLNIFGEKLKEAKNCRDICQALFEFLDANGASKKIDEYIKGFKEDGEIDNANEYSQVWDILVDVLDQMVEVMGENEFALDEFSKLLLIGFSQYTAGVIPPSLDQVLVGSVDRMRSHDVKALYVIGVNDGVFPRGKNDEGILNDRDRENLRELGMELAADTRTKAFEEQFIVYSTLSSASRYLRISYSLADHEGRNLRPSIIISRIKKLFPEIREESSLVIENTDEETLRLISSPLPTFTEMITVIRMDRDGTELKPVWKDVYKWFFSREEWNARATRVLEGLNYTNQVESIGSERAREIYGDNNLFSVSRLEKYAACPFAYFIKYGLNAKERKVYRITPPDLGTFMHNVLDEFARVLEKEKTSWKDVDRNFCRDAVSIIVDDMIEKIPGTVLNSSPRYRYMAERLKRLLTTAVWVIAEHIKRGNFEPEGYEAGFGPYDAYPPIKIILENGEEIDLIGRIDRLDIFDGNNADYVRIIDYKSGNKDLNLSDVYYGLQLQLLIYLDAILEGNKKSRDINLLPAGILYFKIDDPIVRAKGELTDEQIENEILKELKMRGLLLRDPEVIRNMDTKMEGNSEIIPASMKQDGTLGSKTKAVSLEQFDILRDYVKLTIKDLSNEMLGGNIRINPYKKNKNTPCKFCEYAAICQFDTSISGNKYRMINDKSDEEVWDLMEKETAGGDEA